MTRLSKRVRYAEKAGSFFDMELSKISNLSPANISINEIRLTPAQKMLLKLLTESVKNNIPITMDVMIDFYIKYVKKSFI